MIFDYPHQPHARKHGPRGYVEYTSFKDWLRDEFQFRCVYCLSREMWYPNRSDSFTVDHAKPLSDPAFAHLSRVYDNLLYACTRCNSAKREHLTLDPTETGMAIHVRINADGSIVVLTPEGQDFVDLLDLDSVGQRTFRRSLFRIVALCQRYPTDPDIVAMYHEAFGFPPDLPNLTEKRPPDGNTRPNGVKDCCWQQRAAGRLPETY